PPAVISVVVSVLCRLTFDFALWSEGQVPVTLVCEEAHRYVPANPNLGFEPCKRAIDKIAKEGRKYGASLCVVTQRPAEIDRPSCRNATPCEGIAFGDSVTLPVCIKFDELPKHCLPRSSTACFPEKWQKSVGDAGFLEGIVDRWRNASS